ncbi:hypothetical protein AB4039_14265 [Streptomyces sp. M-16]|uniref:hypothetical protein n=1 Tax=Streptomyces sp. M-16 TaxID=3233040 RepID=UPI00225C3B85
MHKAWSPLTGRRLGFEDAGVVLDPVARRFTARPRGTRPETGGRSVGELAGRCTVHDGLLLTAVARPAA